MAVNVNDDGKSLVSASSPPYSATRRLFDGYRYCFLPTHVASRASFSSADVGLTGGLAPSFIDIKALRARAAARRGNCCGLVSGSEWMASSPKSLNYRTLVSGSSNRRCPPTSS